MKGKKKRKNFSEHDEKVKRRRTSQPRKKEGHGIFCLFSVRKKISARHYEKREVEALRSNSEA